MSVLDLPFDQYQRYRLVTDLIGEVRDPGRRLSVLDVGGRTALLRGFLPEDLVTLVDVEPARERRLVLGDGAALPFADASFDLVCAFDTLEHVPARRRKAFVTECRRVAKSWVVIAGPFRSPPVDEAELLLQRFLREKLKLEHRYLGEHRARGLPVRTQVERLLADSGAEVQSYGHGNVRRWLALMALSLYLDHQAELRDLARQVYRYYNRALYAADRAGPVYRHAVVGALRGAPLPARRGAPAGEEARAAEDGAPLVELAFDLIGFDRARGAWEEQNRRLWSVQETLRADLEGHRKSLADERAIAARLERELARHARETLEIERAAKAREVEEARARAGLEHELGSHRRELEVLRGRLAAEEGAHEATRRTVEDLRAELAQVGERAAGQADLIADLRGGLARHAQETLAIERASKERELSEAAVRAELERELASHRQELGNLRALLEREQAAARAVCAGEAAARAQLEREMETLRALAASSDATAAETRAEAAALRARAAELERETKERADVIRTLERDLDGHRGALREARGELEREARERGEAIRALEQDLDGHRGALRDVHGEADRLRAELEEVRGALAAATERMAAMHAALRSRVEGLKRAFGPKWRG